MPHGVGHFRKVSLVYIVFFIYIDGIYSFFFSFVIIKFQSSDMLNISVVFWPSTQPKMPFRLMHRKEVTHSNGSYERKLRGWKLVDEMGWGKKNSHGTLIDWCTGREWPVNCMTVISAWWRSNMQFQKSSRRLSGRWTINSVKTEVRQFQLELETEIDKMWSVKPHQAKGAREPWWVGVQRRCW